MTQKIKILYACNNRKEADSQAKRFFDNINKDKFEIKFAAYYDSSKSFKHVDWLLDQLYFNLPTCRQQRKEIAKFLVPSVSNISFININNLKKYLSDVVDYSPDLIISDYEPISAMIARTIKCKLWYYSPLHMCDGIYSDGRYNRASTFIYKLQMEMFKQTFYRNYPTPDRKFIYSPFTELFNKKYYTKDSEAIKPYYYNLGIGRNKIAFIHNDKRKENLIKILKCLDYKVEIIDIDKINEDQYIEKMEDAELIICDGATNIVSDALYSGKKIITWPHLKNIECLLNSSFIKYFNYGINLHQVELMERFSVDELNNAIKNVDNKQIIETNKFKQLHEVLEHEYRI